jgi:hypothetical protein
VFSAKRLTIKLAVAAAIVIVSISSLAHAYLTDAGVYVPLNYYTFLPPAAGGSFVDGNFGTSVKRISNAMGTKSNISSGNLTQITNEYSTMSPFNNDDTFLILQHDSYFGLYSGSGTYLRDLPFAINTGSEPRWSRTDVNVIYFLSNNQLKQFNVATQVMSTVHTFSEYTVIRGMGESDISVDGNHFVFVGDSLSIFVYEISTDRKSAVFSTGGRSFDSLYITPNNNITVTWMTAGFCFLRGLPVLIEGWKYLADGIAVPSGKRIARKIA